MSCEAKPYRPRTSIVLLSRSEMSDLARAVLARCRTGASRITVFGMDYLVPRYPNGLQAEPTPKGLPPDVPIFNALWLGLSGA